MILTDIYVPVTDETYDFLLDENAVIDKVLLELVDMISKRVKNEVVPDHREFSLYSFRLGNKLQPTDTLNSCGIHDGDKLMLV